MEIGIIGLPNSGKTTIFNALTRSQTATNAFSSGQLQVNTAVVDVPDERVDRLSAMFNPRKTTYAQVIYNDIAGLGKGVSKSGISGSLLNAMAANDALLLVVRAFEDELVAHAYETVHAERDLNVMESELILIDMTIVDRRLERLAGNKQRGTPEERKRMVQEEELLHRLMAELEQETPLRQIDLTVEERRILGGFGLLSLKPLVRVINADDHSAEAEYAALLDSRTMLLHGRLEEEIAEMSHDEAAEFLHGYGIEEPGLNRAIRMCYEMMGLISFFTVGDDEVRAWRVRRGALAPEAAGAIHTDLQKGFIRAETISYDDLMELGSLAEARKQGKLRLEGKEYVVKDGDVLNIRSGI